MIDLGVVRPGSTIRIPFSSFDKDDGSSITMTNFLAADILIYKAGNTTERASTSGFTATTDFDGKTGKHLAIIDLADNTTADFFNAGSEYLVAIDAVTVDGVTTGGWIARFVIGYPNALINTTIATLASQTSFTLTSGPAEDDALNGFYAIIHDIASAVQLAKVLVLDYTGSTKTVTLVAGGTFTAAAGDNISIMDLAPIQATTLGATLDVNANGEAGVDWGNVGNKTTSNALTGTTIATTQKVDIETIKTQAVTAAAGVTFPTSIASPTNITAATGVDITKILGTAISTPATAGILDVNVKNIDNDAASASGTVTFPNATLASTTNITAGTIAAVTNVTTVNGLAADVITAASIAANAIGASELAADAVTEIRSLANGTSDSGSTTTMVDAARTEADTDYWKGQLIVFTSGNILGQARVITGFNAATDTITFAPATTQAVSTQTYEIWPVGDYLRPTTSGLTLDVSAGGEAGVDWANVGSPTTTVGLSGTTVKTATDVETDTQDIQSRLPAALTSNGNMKSSMMEILTTALTETAGLLAGGFKKFFNIATPASTMDLIARVTLTDTVTTYTGNTPQTGDVYPKVDTEVATLVTGVADIQSRLPAALTSGGNIKAGVQGFLDSVFTEGASGRIAAAFKQFFNIATPAATMDHLILVDTATTATTATNLTNAPTAGDFTAAMKTSLNAATPVVTVSDKTGFSLSAAGVQAIWDALTSALTTVGSIGKWVVDKLDVVVSTRLASASYTAPPTAAAIADQVWEETLTDHSGTSGSTAAALNAVGAAGDPWATALPGAYSSGTAGKIIGDNVNATISSRSTQTSVDTIDSIVDAIKLKTDQFVFTLTNKVDASIQAAGDFAQGAADKVWSTATRELTAFSSSFKTGYALSSAGVQAVWDALTSALTAAGSIGKLLVDNINATISSRSSHSAADTWAVGTRTLTAGTNIVLAKGTGVTGFNDLSAAQVNAEADTALADYDAPTHAELTAQLATADDATLAAISGLNNLSQASVRTAVGLASANLDTQLDALPTNAELATALGTSDDAVLAQIALVKVKTDGLNFAGSDVKATLDSETVTVATNNDKTGYALTSGERVSIADALLTRDWSAVSGAAARSVLNALRFLRNKWSLSGTTLTVTEEDDTTPAWTSEVTTASSADPIIGNDPS